MVAGGLIDIQSHVCRFCGAHDKQRSYIAKDETNIWSAAICETCVDEAAKALARMRRSR